MVPTNGINQVMLIKAVINFIMLSGMSLGTGM
jgi:hypothetical protein